MSRAMRAYRNTFGPAMAWVHGLGPKPDGPVIVPPKTVFEKVYPQHKFSLEVIPDSVWRVDKPDGFEIPSNLHLSFGSEFDWRFQYREIGKHRWVMIGVNLNRWLCMKYQIGELSGKWLEAWTWDGTWTRKEAESIIKKDIDATRL